MSSTTFPLPRVRGPVVRHFDLSRLGMGLIAGAADADPCAVGAYAAVGAEFGVQFLWAAPALFPMMFAVVYLSGKLGRVTRQGLFANIRERHSRWLLGLTLIGAVIGNVVEAAADLGGMAEAVGLLVALPRTLVLLGITALATALPLFGSYRVLGTVLRVLALALVAYIVSAFLAKPDWTSVLQGTIAPRMTFTKNWFAALVALMGTSLSAYLYTWQSNQDAEGQRESNVSAAAGDRRARSDTLSGMFFASLVMYSILLSVASTLHQNGITHIESAADVARALEPVAGAQAKWLFALGLIAVGFLALPVMTVGAAYNLTQTFGWAGSLRLPLRRAKVFYAAIAGFSLLALALNFVGINPMRALLFSSWVQGVSTPALMFLIVRLTSDHELMGEQQNSRAMATLGYVTFGATALASLGLLYSFLL